MSFDLETHDAFVYKSYFKRVIQVLGGAKLPGLNINKLRLRSQPDINDTWWLFLRLLMMIQIKIQQIEISYPKKRMCLDFDVVLKY